MNICDAKNNFDLIVYDFDGVMTNNLVYLSEEGIEFVACNRSDGLAVGMLRDAGFSQIILSTESNSVVLVRAKKLALGVINDCKDKKTALINYCLDNQIELQKVIYVGNDINDAAVMRIVGYPICPADAHMEIKNLALYITRAVGGGGVVRELADLLLKKKDKYE